MTNARTGKPRRPRPSRPKLRAFSVFVEGLTEEDYLQRWRVPLQGRASMTIKGGLTSSITLIDRAIRQRREDLFLQRKGRGSAADEYWCVFDIEDNLPRALPIIEKAIANGFNVAVTNPCIELWILLHFVDQRASLCAPAAEGLAATYMTVKRLSIEQGRRLMETTGAAVSRARALDTMHRDNGSLPRSNPSSSMPQLIAALEVSPHAPLAK